MKRFFLLALLVGAGYFLTPATSEAQVTQVFLNIATNADTTTLAYQPVKWTDGITSCGSRCDAHFWCQTGTCAAIVTAYCRIDGTNSEAWYPCFTCTNPTATGCYSSLANSRQYKFAIESWSSGNVNVKYFSSSQ